MCHLLAYNIIDMSAGMAHNLVLGIEKKSIIAYDQKGFNRFNNCILAWGSGNSGCLGNNASEDYYIPIKIDFFNDKKVKEAYCGFTYSCVLTCIKKKIGNNQNLKIKMMANYILSEIMNMDN